MSNETLTTEELEVLKGIANRAWQVVSQDLPIGNYSRAEVFEIAIDAERLISFSENGEQKQIVLKFYRLGFCAMEGFAKDLFPFKNYE